MWSSVALNRYQLICALLLVFCTAMEASAQDPATASASSPARVETSPFADNDFPTLLRDLKIQPTDLLEVSLSVEDRGAKLTYAPFLYGLVNYVPVVSETRLIISQSNGVTTMGAGVLYDPASPRSRRGTELWLKGAPTELAPLPYVLGLRSRAEDISKGITPLMNEFDGASDERRKAILEEVAAIRARANAMLAEADRAVATDSRAEAARITKFYEGLLQTSIPVLSASFTTSLFAILGGTGVDANGNGLADTEHKVKGRALAFAADFPYRRRLQRRPADGKPTVQPEMFWRWLQFSAAVTTEWQRGSQEEGTQFGRIIGFGFTGGGMVKVLNSNYESTADYKQSFFIPSISVGGSFERRECVSENEALCPDSIEHQTAITPFVDIRVSKTAQFRFGVPLKLTRKVAGDKLSDLGVVAVYALQLGAPK